MQLYNIENWRQQHDGDCLAACVAMILQYHSIKVRYSKIKQKLAVTEQGTVFSYVSRMRSLRLTVEVGQCTIAQLQAFLAEGNPVIVAVATELLPYWMTRTDRDENERETEHAVVVVGIEEDVVYINDPDFDEAPQQVDTGWLQDAWQLKQNQYAVIRRRY